MSLFGIPSLAQGHAFSGTCSGLARSSAAALNVAFMGVTGVADNARLTMMFSCLLQRNYKSMNNIYLAVSITIFTLAFTNPTTF
jgi:hypothetical protein